MGGWPGWRTGAEATRDPRTGGLILTGVVRDITVRKQAEAAARESKERLQLALSAARMGIWTWDVTADIQTRDASLNRLLGLEPAESRHPSG